MNEVKSLIKKGLWTNNAALVQLLGLCPLLAVSNNAINGIGLGFATLLVLAMSNLTVAALRHWIRKEIRIPVFVLVIATLVTVVEQLMNAYTHQLYLSLGIFIPLIVTNCAIIGRAEAYASKNTVGLALIDGIMHGVGFAMILILLGMTREILGMGTLFDGAEFLLGETAKDMTITLAQFENPLLLALLPPGAFILLGFFIAAKNYIEQKLQRIQSKTQQKQPIKRAHPERTSA